MAAWVKAAPYRDAVLNQDGTPLRGAAVDVRTAGGALAGLWADEDKATPLPNPTATDANGNLGFYAVPGDYTIIVSPPGQPAQPAVPVTIDVHPDELTDLARVRAPSATAPTSPQLHDVWVQLPA